MNFSRSLFFVFLCSFNEIFVCERHSLVVNNKSKEASTIIITPYTSTQSYPPRTIIISPTSVVSIHFDELETELLKKKPSLPLFRNVEIFTPDGRQSLFVQELCKTVTRDYRCLTITRLTKSEEEHAREEMLKPKSGILLSCPAISSALKIKYQTTLN